MGCSSVLLYPVQTHSELLFPWPDVWIMDNKITENETPEVAKKDNEACKTIEQTKERKNMKEEKARKKDDKSVEQVLKALSSLDTAEEKLAAMCKKYSDIVDDNRKLQLALKQAEKKVVVIQREKEQFQSEHSKAILTRSRLESLCRELQRQNKAVKDESLLKIREEEEKRKEVSAKFQSTLSEITALMSQNNEKNTKLHEDNLEMTKKFKSVCEQYEIREQQVEKMQQQMKLEAQLAEAKLAKAKMEMAAEKEVLLKEKQQLLLNLTEYQVRIREHQATEVGLRGQISMYTDKYDEFQNALTKSNEVFGGFKDEMEKMSKKILKLEKETSSWKQRWENSHAALLEMAADKQQRDAELATTSRKLAQLQQLCRALQGERASLLAQLRGKDAASAGPEATDEAVNEESIKSIKQVDDISKDCQQLKENLVYLQGSLAEAIKKEEEEKLQKADKEEAQRQKQEPDERQKVVILNTNVEHSTESKSEINDEAQLKNKENNVAASSPAEIESDESKVENGETNGGSTISVETPREINGENESATALNDSVTNKNASIEGPVEPAVEDSCPALKDEDKSAESACPGTKKGKDGKKKKK
ncbi:gamma-taxilin isoform X1 [Diprion similis]|uniref:gamma-taxilin isoform X1 n=2 Tax=Diprion similis TaxID=362088 RepID=UPI001EF96CA1|nr:gamma-taxilin isoform X1 [Diprion similis]